MAGDISELPDTLTEADRANVRAVTELLSRPDAPLNQTHAAEAAAAAAAASAAAVSAGETADRAAALRGYLRTYEADKRAGILSDQLCGALSTTVSL